MYLHKCTCLSGDMFFINPLSASVALIWKPVN